ncbi:MAG TPA: LacI family DNA-binding transcriptional regulator [Opitutaceae bacterium]|nr:LacI family DNA-binding transcriptional regulator [Opitutaceae bacterium]
MTARPPHSAVKNTAPARRPTMRDVARLAGGVHPSTVSLALRNHPGISEATRKRVRAAARTLGYRPDPLLDAFNTHRLEVLPHKALPVIAYISDFDSRQALEKSHAHSGYWLGARAAAESLHCQIELFLLSKAQLTPERLHSILRARGITSLVLGACRSHTTRVAFDWPDYSAAKIESPHLDAPIYGIISDHRQSARLAFRKLRALGYRRIGLATTPGGMPRQDELSRAGYLLEQRVCAGERLPAPLDLDETPDAGVVLRWIQTNRLDAVISDRLELREILSGKGLRVGFAGLDVPRNDEQFAGIVIDHGRVGAQAVEQVVSLMRANQRGLPATSSCTHVPVAWQDGKSAPAR